MKNHEIRVHSRTGAQSMKITKLLFFVLAPGSCDFASCFAMLWKGDFSWFRGAKVCFYYGFYTFASKKHKKSRFSVIFLKVHVFGHFGGGFWGPQPVPSPPFLTTKISILHRCLIFGPTGASGGLRGRFWNLRGGILEPLGVILEPPGSILEPPGLILEPPGPNFVQSPDKKCKT